MEIFPILVLVITVVSMIEACMRHANGLKPGRANDSTRRPNIGCDDEASGLFASDSLDEPLFQDSLTRSGLDSLVGAMGDDDSWYHGHNGTGFDDVGSSLFDSGSCINPANGLPMISGDMSGIDVCGNPYGFSSDSCSSFDSVGGSDSCSSFGSFHSFDP